jgi:hypothetical protein
MSSSCGIDEVSFAEVVRKRRRFPSPKVVRRRRR